MRERRWAPFAELAILSRGALVGIVCRIPYDSRALICAHWKNGSGGPGGERRSTAGVPFTTPPPGQGVVKSNRIGEWMCYGGKSHVAKTVVAGGRRHGRA